MSFPLWAQLFLLQICFFLFFVCVHVPCPVIVLCIWPLCIVSTPTANTEVASPSLVFIAPCHFCFRNWLTVSRRFFLIYGVMSPQLLHFPNRHLFVRLSLASSLINMLLQESLHCALHLRKLSPKRKPCPPAPSTIYDLHANGQSLPFPASFNPGLGEQRLSLLIKTGISGCAWLFIKGLEIVRHKVVDKAHMAVL